MLYVNVNNSFSLLYLVLLLGTVASINDYRYQVVYITNMSNLKQSTRLLNCCYRSLEGDENGRERESTRVPIGTQKRANGVNGA